MIQSPAGYQGDVRIKRYLDFYQAGYGVAMLSSGGAFSPLSLFANGEQGGWYDPSDLTTLFQDAAGTTPVTAVEQPVGRVLDKSGRGNHLSQSTAAARPVLSARVNLLTYTDTLSDVVWTAVGAKNVSQSGSDWVVTDNSASVVQGIQQTGITVANGVTYKGTFKVKKTTGTPSNYPVYQIGLNNLDTSYSGVIIDTTNGTLVTLTGGVYSAPAASSVEASGDYWLVSLSVTMSSTATRVQIYPAASANGTTVSASNTGSITIREPDLRPANAGVGLPSYQRVGAATDYDTTGFPLYLRFDGTDDFLQSSTITPGSVDKAQVFAGVRKLSDAADRGLLDYGPSWATQAGSFGLYAPSYRTGGLPAPKYTTALKGSTGVRDEEYATYTAPITNVLAIAYDIGAAAASEISTRINGGVVSPSSAGGDAGGGNFSSLALQVGRYGTSPSFNGHLYSLILRFGANLDAATITATETWVNQRTKAF